MPPTAEALKAATKPRIYPALESLMGEVRIADGEHVYEVNTGAGVKFVKAVSPAQAALAVVSVQRVPQKRLLYAASQALLNRRTEAGGQ